MVDDLRTIADGMEGFKKFFYVLSNPVIIWDWCMDVAFWLTIIFSCFMLLYYAVTGSKKPVQYMWVAIVTYILLKGVDMVL
jgi:hypothetical protein